MNDLSGEQIDDTCIILLLRITDVQKNRGDKSNSNQGVGVHVSSFLLFILSARSLQFGVGRKEGQRYKKGME